MKLLLRLIPSLLFILAEASADSQVVLISGSGGGLGLATAKAFQAKDWKVWAGYHTSIPEEFSRFENICPIALDVTKDDMIEQALQTILLEDGKIDVLINNAGYGLIGVEENVSIEQVQRLFDVNFFGALKLIQATVPSMRKEKSGHIINISSTSGVRAVPGLGLYAASKFALEGLSESLAVTLSPWNIQVSLIEPGSVMNDWAKHCAIAEDSVNEPLYHSLEKALLEKLTTLASTGQNVDEIAELIVSVAETSKPDMRYPTSDKVKETMSRKLVDTSGNAMRDEQTRFFNSLIGN